MEIYIDGQLDNFGASDITSINNNANVEMFKLGNRDFLSGGTGSPYGFLNGSMNEASVWNVSLSHNQIINYLFN